MGVKNAKREWCQENRYGAASVHFGDNLALTSLLVALSLLTAFLFLPHP
jgi:hypothetical protein